jgi:hypothetical protein
MPAIAAPLPQPEAPRPPLPAARLAALPQTPTPAPVTPPPDVIASTTPQPPPPVPELAPITPPPTSVKPRPKRPPASAAVATLEIGGAGSPTATAAADRAQFARVAALYRQQPGTVRVVAFAAAPAPGADPLASYHAALDRAQSVAKALAGAGVPPGRIKTEATPASGAQLGRVEIQFAP